MKKKLLVMLVAILLPCGSVFALSVKPSRCELNVKPGKSTSGVYMVTNDTDKPLKVEISIKDWFISDQNKDLTCEKWLTFKPMSMNLAPKETKKVNFKVKAPKTADGALFAMLSMRSMNSEADMLNVVISVPVFVILTGTEKVNGNLEKIAFRKEGDNLQVSFDVVNNGNIHLRPKGVCVLKAVDGSENVIDIPEARPVYPGKMRTSVGRTALANLKDGVYTAVIRISSGNIELTFQGKVVIDKSKDEFIVE